MQCPNPMFIRGASKPATAAKRDCGTAANALQYVFSRGDWRAYRHTGIGSGRRQSPAHFAQLAVHERQLAHGGGDCFRPMGDDNPRQA